MPAWRATAHAPREATAAKARDLKLEGWVRQDGDVLNVHAEGDAEALQALEAFLREHGDVELTKAKVEGHEQFGIRGVPHGRFVVREHGAFELQLEGVPNAWTVPKQPSMNPADKRFAIEAEPTTEGTVWDEGDYEQGGRVPWPEAIERGHAVFVLHGEKLQGGFALQRSARGWLLIKRRER